MANCKICHGFGDETLINGKVCECQPVLGKIADLSRRITIINNLKARNEIKRMANKYKAHKYMAYPMMNFDIYPDRDRWSSDDE